MLAYGRHKCQDGNSLRFAVSLGSFTAMNSSFNSALSDKKRKLEGTNQKEQLHGKKMKNHKDKRSKFGKKTKH